MNKVTISEEIYNNHRSIATQIEVLYVEINKLATKKPSDRITPLVARKINHVITKVKDLVTSDEFLDAIETIPVQGEVARLDEVLIILAELRGVMDRQWNSEGFKVYRTKNGIGINERQVIR